jgi:hypothetical protein
MVQGSNPGQGKRFFSSPECPDQLWGLLSFLINGYYGSLTEVKKPERQVNHSPPQRLMSAAISLLSLYAYMVWTGKTLSEKK